MACGARLRAWRQDGFQRWRCPRCGWIFYDNPVPATVAIVVGPRGILLCRRAAAPYRGYWDLAGGFLEADETPERGLRRELREELARGSGGRASATSCRTATPRAASRSWGWSTRCAWPGGSPRGAT
jgi:hypothetical protein